ncbi:hypothetical protein BpHYR1_021846 [Brachionus plicatilis]|uniref:Uncharacterized protein n=1 Tax=Brachionus plicatilis TaxID=10195 RepID=A0A3M7T3Y8_BRAPC|nr:hypothetical protein BpHYR1_021846 [Brachionus plicatilis]
MHSENFFLLDLKMKSSIDNRLDKKVTNAVNILTGSVCINSTKLSTSSSPRSLGSFSSTSLTASLVIICMDDCSEASSLILLLFEAVMPVVL